MLLDWRSTGFGRGWDFCASFGRALPMLPRSGSQFWQTNHAYYDVSPFHGYLARSSAVYPDRELGSNVFNLAVGQCDRDLAIRR